MSANSEHKLKKVSSTDSLFSNNSEFDNENIYNVLKTCKTIKKGDEIIPLIVSLKNLLDENKEIAEFGVDFFYQFDNLFFLFSKNLFKTFR